MIRFCYDGQGRRAGRGQRPGDLNRVASAQQVALLGRAAFDVHNDRNQTGGLPAL